ncbi:MAG: glycosyl hydrolase [Anaerolineales bacterium]
MNKIYKSCFLMASLFFLLACNLMGKASKAVANPTQQSPNPTSAPTALSGSNSTNTQQANQSGSQTTTAFLSPPTIPHNGVYLGAWVNPAKGASGGGPTFASQLPQFQADLGGRLPGILNFYTDFLTPLPLTDLQTIEAKGSIPLISWGGAGSCATSSIPSGQYTSGIAAGQYDQQITQYANSLKAFGHPVFVRWFWEMNLGKKNDPCNGSAGASGYVAAWRHIYTLFHQAGATNVAFVWCPALSAGLTGADNFYPGADYIDWIGIDGYLKDSNTASSFAELFGAWYAKYVTYQKPLIVVETGAPQNDQANYFNGIGQSVPTQFPDLKAILYFDALGNNGDWALTQPGLEAFAQLLANPYFSPHQ